jgi:hypothetical protein
MPVDIDFKLRSDSVHPRSLVDRVTHSPILLGLIEMPINQDIIGAPCYPGLLTYILLLKVLSIWQYIGYIVDLTTEVINYAVQVDRSTVLPPLRHTDTRNTRLTNFVKEVLHSSETTTPTILVSLVYTMRLKRYLQFASEDAVHERLFMGTLILASKYANDASLRIPHWAMCNRMFGARELARIERELLEVMDYHLSVTEDDILLHSALTTVFVQSGTVFRPSIKLSGAGHDYLERATMDSTEVNDEDKKEVGGRTDFRLIHDQGVDSDGVELSDSDSISSYSSETSFWSLSC